MSIRKAKKQFKKMLRLLDEVFTNTSVNVAIIDYEKKEIKFKKTIDNE